MFNRRERKSDETFIVSKYESCQAAQTYSRDWHRDKYVILTFPRQILQCWRQSCASPRTRGPVGGCPGARATCPRGGCQWSEQIQGVTGDTGEEPGERPRRG